MCRVARFRSCWMFSMLFSMALFVVGTVAPGYGKESTDAAPPTKPVPVTGRVTEIPRAAAVRASKNAAPTTPANPAAGATELDKAATVATHRQSSIVQVNVAGQKPMNMACFCLTTDDRILAGGGAGESREIRVFDADGKYLEAWKMPVNPEAIFAGNDGTILVAGDGQIVKVSAKGTVELQKQGPHVAALQEHPEKLREEVIAQAKQRAEQLGRQSKVYDQMIERVDKQIAAAKEQIAALDQPADDSANTGDNETDANKRPAARRVPRDKASLERQLTMYNQQKEAYGKAKAQWAEMMKNQQAGPLTEEQIDAQVKASLAYKQKASSISASGDDVFLATHAATGYGFAIWRMDNEFGNPAMIVKDLSGCCGQMDVKANKDGVFVAENSRHRVRRFDREGKELGAWGFSARTGLEGFGSCCNPMNVAFGPDSAVYTSEDDTGRIKRYSVEGKMLGLVGAVELKPGCKNVSIAVSSDGSRVYMLDITRNHLVRMDARPAEEVAAEVKALKDAPQAATPEAEAAASTSAPKTSTTARIVLRGLRAIVPSKAPAKE